MIKRLLIIDGVLAVCQFRDDGSLVEGYGLVNETKLRQLSALAHQYRRLLQGNADQLSMFSGMKGLDAASGLGSGRTGSDDLLFRQYGVSDGKPELSAQ